MNYKNLLSLFLLGWSMIATAQTVCNEDGTVTFRYKNDQAKNVMVDVQFAGRNPMQYDGWTTFSGLFKKRFDRFDCL